MARLLIKGYGDKYSISSEGDVYCHYRITKSGINFCDVKVNKFFARKGHLSPSVSLSKDGKHKKYLISTLMIEHFGIQKPDNVFRYVPYWIDGNDFNNSIDNLGFRLRIDKEYKYTPEVYYNDSKPYALKCGCCGEKKLLKSFIMAYSGGSPKYAFHCKSCKSKKRWESVKNDPEKLKIYRENGMRYSSKPERIKYVADYNKNARDQINDKYLNWILSKRGFDLSVLNEDFRNAYREKIRLERLIKNNRKNERL